MIYARALNNRQRTRSKLQASYAGYLELLKRAGEIHDYREEPLTFRLADRTTYKPDFLVIEKGPEYGVALHEVKGGYIEEDAWAKLKIGAELFPWFEFHLIRWKGRAWQDEKI